MLKIREVRERRGFTRAQLAEKSGISANMIGNYEHGSSDITLTKLFAIARALECSFYDLLHLKASDLPDATIDNRHIENEISATLEGLPQDLQIKILKSYLIESRKTITALQGTKISELSNDITNLEEYVYENISGMFGKTQANEYRDRLKKRKNSNEKEEGMAG